MPVTVYVIPLLFTIEGIIRTPWGFISDARTETYLLSTSVTVNSKFKLSITNVSSAHAEALSISKKATIKILFFIAL
jgi:hypothetical protein